MLSELDLLTVVLLTMFRPNYLQFTITRPTINSTPIFETSVGKPSPEKVCGVPGFV